VVSLSMIIVLAMTLILVCGAGLVLASFRGSPIKITDLMIGLTGAATLTGCCWAFTGHIWTSFGFALAAGAGAAASVIDARSKLLPDSGAGLVAIAGLSSALIGGNLIPALLSAGFSSAILAGAGWITRRPGRAKTLGEGDILLGGACGLWLSPDQVPYALLAAVAITVAAGLASGSWNTDGANRIAFGPGIALGYGVSFIGWAAYGALPLT